MAEANPQNSDCELSGEEAMEVHPIAAMMKAVGATCVNSENDNLDWLYQKNKSERMYELRSLKLGEKPVTGQGHKEAINEFLTNKIQAAEKAASGTNVPSNSENVEEHRPEAVVVEVTGLFERRPVTSMLQSQSFRRQLERIVRGSVSEFRRVSEPRAQAQAASAGTSRTVPPAPSTPPAQTASSSNTETSRTSQPRSREDATQAQPSTRSRADSRRRVHEGRRHSQPQAPVPVAPTPPPVFPPTDVLERVGPAVPWLARQPAWHVPTQRGEISREEGQRLAWNSIEQSYRENIITEISELVHRQLVTSSLDGEFRGVLELHMQNHLQNTNTDGPAVQDFIRNIPHSDNIIQNDFSHLGIQGPAPPGSDSLDSASIISATAHSVPYAQTNRALSREIKGLKSQLEELKQMMSLSFNIQCDIQRSIRQEVAAAMNQHQAEGATAASVRSVPVDDTQCLICLEANADTVIYSCGHLCLCQKCGYTLQNTGGKCPVCRAPIKDLLKVFKCSAE